MSDCIICQIVAGDLPADFVYQDDLVVAFKDIAPMAPVHVLIAPRRHIADASVLQASDGDLLADMFLAAKAVADGAGISAPDRGYRLMLNVGPDSMNSIAHLHLHVIGGKRLTGHMGAQ